MSSGTAIMNPVHLDDEERRMVKSVLAFLEALLVRLNTGEPLPNAMLGEIVDFFREAEDAGGEASARGGVHPSVSEGVAEHETAAAPLCDMLWALESLDRGEAGAAGAFVISSRRYIQGCRGRLREDALGALTSPGTQLTVN